MAFQNLHHLIGDVIDRLALSLRERLNEMFYQQRDVVFSFPQWRHRDRKYIEP